MMYEKRRESFNDHQCYVIDDPQEAVRYRAHVSDSPAPAAHLRPARPVWNFL